MADYIYESVVLIPYDPDLQCELGCGGRDEAWVEEMPPETWDEFPTYSFDIELGCTNWWGTTDIAEAVLEAIEEQANGNYRQFKRKLLALKANFEEALRERGR